MLNLNPQLDFHPERSQIALCVWFNLPFSHIILKALLFSTSYNWKIILILSSCDPSADVVLSDVWLRVIESVGSFCLSVLLLCRFSFFFLFTFLFIPLAVDKSFHNTSLYLLLLLLLLLSKWRNDQELATAWSRPTEAHWFPTKGLCVSHSAPAWKESFVPSAGSVLRCWSLPYFLKTVAVHQTVWHFPFSCVLCSIPWYSLLLLHQPPQPETALEQPGTTVSCAGHESFGGEQ